MRKSLPLFIILVCITTITCAQNLTGTIANGENAMLYLKQYNQYKYLYEVYDSIKLDDKSSFSIQQPSRSGLYGLGFNSKESPSMYVWMGEGLPVKFTTTKDSISINIQWQDKTNRSAFEVSKKASDLETRLLICGQLLEIYTDTTGKFYEAVKKEYLNIQQEMKVYRLTVVKRYPGIATSHIIQQYYFNFPGAHYKESERATFLKEHFLDNVNFSDTLLQASHLLKDKINQFFKLYGFPEKFRNANDADVALRPALAVLIKQCINSVYTKNNTELQLNAVEYVTRYLFKEFGYMGMDAAIDFLVGQIPDYLLTNNRCVEGNQDEVLRINTYKNLLPGKSAPDMSFEIEGQHKTLKDINAQYTLVIFWASWCAHCEELLPHIVDLYNSTSRDKLQILAVSIDTNINNYKNAIREHSYNWYNYCSGMGWNDKTVQEYGITGTPTIFLLDEQKNIVSKPMTINEIKKALDY